ncbi:hypothetical protein PR202_ga15376 [Eleusine coracana subsp. coracana]|uniref:BED-type domain-containing protein n=1 Tax=Eleusine coracana subsp. coracana TaxID=191504 RepID=A0AAV5CJP5_ELECO|nr:hypothetical protein PR202_ga15376 [Eleusine coracana subsp. coracana]
MCVDIQCIFFNISESSFSLCIRSELAGATSTGGTFMVSPSSSSRASDPAWIHAKVVAGSKGAMICLHCGKKIGGGGITRFKYHLAGIPGQVESCKKVPNDVKHQMKQLLDARGRNEERRQETGVDHSTRFEDSSYAIFSIEGNSASNFRPSRKRRTGYFPPHATIDSEPISDRLMASEDMVQHGMVDAEAPNDQLHEARIAIARWWYDADVPFSAAKSPFYQPMLEAIASAGLGFKGPSYHDLREPLLKHIAEEIREYLHDLRREWSVRGCSIIADRLKGHGEGFIINFLVYCPQGTMFLKSVDTSAENTDLLEIFDEVIRDVGSENIVQFITDIDARYKAAVKTLEERYGTFVWSPCAARCIDLMLENFADAKYFPMVNETLEKARKITKFIYNHAWVLSLMRKEFTNGRDLCRPAISRFATHFLSLQCIVKFEKELRQMVSCNKWVKSTYAKGGPGKDVSAIILKDVDFWAHCKEVVKVTEPLLRVLRLVDSNENPSMGYLYEAMEKAKESIRSRMMHRACLYGPYVRVIDARMERQLHSPLHAAGCFFNPGIYFSPSFRMQSYAFRGLIKTIASLVRDGEIQDKIFVQLEEYKKSTGDFGLPIAIRQREKLNPVAWWDNFGNGTLELQSLAVRVLSQCCSATGCERNWEIFEFLHSSKLSRLERSRISDGVFIRYNLKLRERNQRKLKDAIDPISLDNIDILEEWVSEEPSLLCRDDLNWESVDAPFAEPTSDDEELVVVDDNDEEATVAALPWSGADDVYCPQPDQDPYVYVTKDSET